MEVMEQKTSHILMYVALFAITVLAIPVVNALMTNSVTIGNTGSIKAIGVSVYWDALCTNEVSSVDWSVLEPGSAENKTIYIKNTGNSAATLTLETDTWVPTNASTYIGLTWNYDGQPLAPDAVVEVILTLTISEDIEDITTFSFDILIIGSG
jgi:hypothetical protein